MAYVFPDSNDEKNMMYYKLPSDTATKRP